MTNKIIYCLLYFFISNCFSQNQKKIDSLSNLVLIYKNTGNIKDSVKVNLNLKLSKEYNHINPEKQLMYASLAYNLSKKIKYKKGLGQSNFSLAKAKINEGKYNEAILFSKEAIKIFTQLKDKKNQGDSYFCLAQCYIFKSNYPEAIFNLNQAITYHENIKDYMGMAVDYNNFGVLYSNKGDYKKAINYYNKILVILKKHRSKKGDNFINIANANIATVFISQNKIPQAIVILKDCLKKDSINLRISGIAFNCLSLGKSYLLLNKNKKAIEYLDRAEDLFVKTGNNSALCNTYGYLGTAYFNLKNIEKAMFYTKKGLRFSKDIGELESIKFSYGQLSKLHAFKKEYKESLEYQILYKTISDSIMNTEINKNLTQIQMTHEFEKKQKRIEEIQKKKEALLKEETQKQRNIKYTISAILLLVSFFTFWIYKNLKRNQKQKEIIENQNTTIQQSLSEKEVLLREIHHRVKNNLQIISSLLNIQSEDSKDEKIVASLQEGKSRVEAMSLIHQNLYQSEQINKVAIDNYLKELIRYISDLFSKNNNKISTEVITSNYHFDIDTAIPLGLIINELVTNAYKYAFVNKEDGEIKISIEKVADKEFKLEVTDNGIGLPENFDIKKTKSLGLSLVSILSRQLRGKLETHSQKNKTTFTVFFKETEIV